ncbi:MAG TPA: FGGY-family carbohydrate kinase [Chthonomonadales bacterium]|nr:FGGY-family carbohydrate kinase [Chthonomonadales bacterium]
MSRDRVVIGVDVGTGSARAGVFNLNGKMLASATEPIRLWKPKPDYAEQSSTDIWRAVCQVVRGSRERADVPPEAVVGIGFDATCSLVAVGANGEPVAVNDEGVAERDIIVWMDHRALAETDEINAGGYEVLRYVGGRLSPEMETPKLLWLKRHLPSTWAWVARFFDLADYLTWRSTGIDVRSLCTVVCKWTYLGHEGERGRWDRDYFRAIGIGDVFDGGRVVDDVRPMGERIGPLTERAAADLGLTTATAVGVGIIDAHAGGLGLMGAVWSGKADTDLAALETAVALIGGTSNCHMAVSREPRFIDGVWGPYYGAMVPGMWLTEGGQSTAGSAIDHAIADHANAPRLAAEAKRRRRTVYELLNAEVARLQAEQSCGPEVTRAVHVLPDFLGNRSPKADPHARATIDGISLDTSITSQALRYYATIQAVAYGTRDIVAAMNRAGYSIRKVLVTGGGTRNPLWLQEHADATGCTFVLPNEPEAVLLGSAVLAATAAGAYPSIYRAMQAMSRAGATVRPRRETAAYHRAKFAIFQDLYREQLKRRRRMAGF